MKNKIGDLRNALFDQLDRLQDSELDLDEEVKRAKSIVDISNALVDTVRVECDFLKIKQNVDQVPDFLRPGSSLKEVSEPKENPYL